MAPQPWYYKLSLNKEQALKEHDGLAKSVPAASGSTVT